MPKAKAVSNQEIALAFTAISEYLAMQDVPFKPQAYARAAQSVGELDADIRDLYAAGGIAALKKLPGVGQSIAEHIEELLRTGRLRYLEQLKKQAPVDVAALTMIEGLGPKSIKRLYTELNIRTVADLARAAKAGKIRGLKGFGPKTEENILKGIEFLKQGGGRFSIGAVAPVAEALERQLAGMEGVGRVTVAGSMRRFKETVGDLDILAVAKHPARLTAAFTLLPNVVRVLARGDTKASVKLVSGLQVDLRVVPAAAYGAALNYFTGSKAHNVALRERAVKRGLKLNEYGLWKGRRRVAGRTEEEVYRALGMAYVEPELREHAGEIEAAVAGRLPNLVRREDIQGDLQVQTDWSDGSASIEGMANAAAARGLKYIVITDHTKRLAMTHGLDGERLLAQMSAIDRVQKKLGSRIKILKGTECDILKDGSLDIEDRVLAKLDVVGVSLHSFFTLPEREQTARVLRALANPHVDVFFHPTGRIIGKRAPCKLNMPEVIGAAKRYGVALEVNSFPDRLDLSDDHVRQCVREGVKLAIDSDAHAPQHFDLLRYGVATARRGWAEAKDVVNARPAEAMLRMLRRP